MANDGRFDRINTIRRQQKEDRIRKEQLTDELEKADSLDELKSVIQKLINRS